MKRNVALGLIAGLLVLACSDSYLFDPRRRVDLPVDRSLTVEAQVCTPGANELVRPIKILLAMDASQSMRVTDPDGTRASALVELLASLPEEPEVHVSVLLFAGSTSVWLNRSGGPDFDQVVSLTPAERLTTVERILNFTNPDVNRDSTDFVKALSDVYAAVNRDIALSRALDQSAARYSVIFLSDGAPSEDQDRELLQGDAVRRIRQLRELADDVVFNTVHVFLPSQPVGSVCDLSGASGDGLPAAAHQPERGAPGGDGRAGRRRLPRLPQQRAHQLPVLPLRQRPSRVAARGARRSTTAPRPRAPPSTRATWTSIA